MHILHIGHYDIIQNAQQSFMLNVTNGIERFLTTLISKDEQNKHFVLFFEEMLGSISISELYPDGSYSMYTTYPYDVSEPQKMAEIIQELHEKLGISIVHFHYQQAFILKIPKAIELVDVKLLVTIHDESYIASEYGLKQDYQRREDVAAFFAKMEKIIFPHSVIQKRHVSLYPEIEHKTSVIANGVTLPYRAQINRDTELQVLFLGGINKYKGADIVSEIAQHTDLPMAFHLLGMLEGTASFVTENTFDPDDIVDKITEINPDVIVIPSIVQESFSYTASEATALGYPVVAFSVGSLADIEKENRGYTVQIVSANAMLEMLENIQLEKVLHPEIWEQRMLKIRDIHVLNEAEMIDAYTKIYISLNSKKTQAIDRHYFDQKNYINLRADIQLIRKERAEYRVVRDALEEANQHKLELTNQVEYLRKHPLKNLIVAVLNKLGVKKLD